MQSIDEQISQRVDSLAEYRHNLENYHVMLANIDTTKVGMAEFKKRLEHLVVTEETEGNKEELILQALNIRKAAMPATPAEPADPVTPETPDP